MKPAISLKIDKIQAQLNEVHLSGLNLTYEWRIKQLKTLQRMFSDNGRAICDAVGKDLGLTPTVANITSVIPVQKEIAFALKNLKYWMKPEAVTSNFLLFPGFSYIERKPLMSPGVLIIGPFNYPVSIPLKALVGALSGGNPAIIKPSEQCPRVAQLLKTLFDKYFDPSVAQVMLGGVRETSALLEKQWGKVFFTGSERVGRIIGAACAKTLTPVILELGGKTPTVVDESVNTKDIQNVADRIIFSKMFNGGQTCVAPDVLFVHKHHASELCNAMIRSIQLQFGKSAKEGELGRMVNRAHTNRLIDMINEVNDSVIYGQFAACDAEDRYIAPTLVLDPPASSRLLQEEIFGPVLPIITFSSRAEGIELIQGLHGTPLQLYVFARKNSIFRLYTDKCRSAAAFHNDCLIQISNHHLPMGGLGTSGHGEYFGKFSYDSFTHTFPIVYRPLGRLFDLNNLRCSPHFGWKGSFLEKFIFSLPDIPVLHTRKLLALVLLCFIASTMPERILVLKLLLADCLEKLAIKLRQ